MGTLAVQTVQARNHFELIPTAKMKTRHHVEGYFGSGFPGLVIVSELWRPEVVRH